MDRALATLLTTASLAAIGETIDPSAQAAGGAWIRLMPAGAFSSPRDGRRWSSGDRASMDAIVAATLQIAGSTEIVVDYDHQTEFGAVEGVGGQAPAAGWIKELQVRADGIWGRVEWTSRAARAIRTKEYRYLSPTFLHDKSGRVLVIKSAALTNTPAIDDLVAAAASALRPQPKDLSMDKIAAALGMAAGSSEDAILAALNTIMTGTVAIAKAVGLSDTAKPDDIVTAVASARSAAPDPSKFVPIAALTELQAEVKALKDNGAAERAETAVASAIKGGKVAPALKDWALSYAKQDPAGFAAYVGGAPVLTKPQLTAATPPAGDRDGRLDADQVAVCRAMGIDPETYAKTIAAEAKEQENA